MSLYQYKGTIRRVIDGDTLEVDVALGFYITKTIRVRLRGINAPEPRGETREAGIVSASALVARIRQVAGLSHPNADEELARIGAPCTLQSFRGKSFDRWVAEVTVDGSLKTLGEWMVENGFAEDTE